MICISTFKGWLWIFAFLPFGLAIFAVVKTKEYLEAKDEQSNGQSEPKVSRYGKMVLAFVVTVLVCYIVYGLFGMVFAGDGFGDMWGKLVADFWINVFMDLLKYILSFIL